MVPLNDALLEIVGILIMYTPLGGGHIIFAFSAIRRRAWFPVI